MSTESSSIKQQKTRKHALDYYEFSKAIRIRHAFQEVGACGVTVRTHWVVSDVLIENLWFFQRRNCFV